MTILKNISPARLFSLSIQVAILLFFLYLAEILFIQSEHTRLVLTDITSPVLNLFATTALGMAAYQTFKMSPRQALAWRLCFLAQFFYLCGDISWMILEAGLGINPFPSVADIFYIAYYPVLFISILLLSDKKQTREDWIKKGLDITIILIASLLLFWNFLIGPIVAAQAGEPGLNQILSLAYPTGDLLVLWGLLVLVYNGSEIQVGKPILLLLLGCLSMVLTDSIFSVQSLSGTYISGGLVEIGWATSYLLFALAGMSQATAGQPNMIAARRFYKNFFSSQLIKTIRMAVPYLLLICAFVLLVVSYLTPMPMNFLTIACGVAITIGLVILRQWMALVENNRLVHQLNLAVERVQNQSADVEMYNQELQIEIAERKRIEGQLAHDALHDGLTGLPNRILFLDRLEHAIEYGKRHPDFHFAVLFLDLDQFKVVNDSLGHTIGDDLLISFGQRLSTCLRTSDSIGRLGGDEFVVLLEDVKDESSVTLAAERILEVQHEHFHINGRDMFITTSIGIVIQTGEYNRAEDLLRDADIAMYHAKELGKARYAVFSTELRSRAIARLELENELRRAIEQQEFQLYYQPIYQLWSEQVTGFEALIRWNHPQRGLLKPESFLPVAEESDLILAIGDWVLRQACTQMKHWRENYPQYENLAVNVNISSRQLSQLDFVEQVERAMKDTGLPASALKLEITESAVIQNQAMANEFFTRLNRLGIQLQVDDFGTGYSSLSYLQHFPIHCIKIDRSFIQEIGRPGKNQDLVRTMIMMAKDLGMEAIAEGIETQEQLELLQSLSCHRGQGFLMSRPLDETSAEHLLQEMNSSQAIPIKMAPANEPLPVTASKRTKRGSE